MTAHSPEAAVVTIVVVDDSAVQRRFVRMAVEEDPTLEVVGEARNGRDAVALVERLRPSAVLMDLHLPVMNGIEAIERIMAVRPTPIVVYSSFVDGADRENATGAIAAGAIDVMSKPAPDDRIGLADYAVSLRRALRVAGRVKVITHPRGRLTQTTTAQVSTRRLGNTKAEPTVLPRQRDVIPTDDAASPTAAAAAGSNVIALKPGVDLPELDTLPIDVLAIGASTGGPQALASLLSELPEDTKSAVLIIQHMADGFMEGLAGWLNTLCPLPVMMGAAGKRLLPGSVTVAPSGLNLIVHEQLRVTTEVPPVGQYHVPGIDATFRSVADSYGSRSAAALLTGMGRDGALGMRAMRDAGAFTIAQDEETCAVYGMPAAAMAIEAATVQLSLPEVIDAVRRLLTPRSAK